MSGVVRDGRSGQFRKDMMLLHITVLDPGVGDVELAGILDDLQRGMPEEVKAKYCILITPPQLQMRLSTVQEYISLLERERDALSNVEIIDTMIQQLVAARNARWDKEDALHLR